jgi:hypothetical protein
LSEIAEVRLVVVYVIFVDRKRHSLVIMVKRLLIDQYFSSLNIMAVDGLPRFYSVHPVIPNLK